MDQASAKYDGAGQSEGPPPPTAEEMVTQYRHLAKIAAARFARPTLHPGRRRQFREDAEAAALYGLWQAAQRHEGGGGAGFDHYSRRRLRGAIVDWFRDADHRTRAEVKAGAPAELVSLDVRTRSPFDGDTDKLGHLLPDDAPPPESAEEARDLIGYALGGLSEVEQEIVRLRFLAGLRMWEVGERVGLSESRVCQVLPDLLARMRERLERIGCA